MRIRIRRVEPGRPGYKITADIGDSTVIFNDPEEFADESLRNKSMEVRILGVEGRVSPSKGPVRFGQPSLVARVVKKEEDYAVLDCGLFSFDYLINLGEDHKFVEGGFVQLDGVRLDLMFRNN